MESTTKLSVERAIVEGGVVGSSDEGKGNELFLIVVSFYWITVMLDEFKGVFGV